MSGSDRAILPGCLDIWASVPEKAYVPAKQGKVIFPRKGQVYPGISTGWIQFTRVAKTTPTTSIHKESSLCHTHTTCTCSEKNLTSRMEYATNPKIPKFKPRVNSPERLAFWLCDLELEGSREHGMVYAKTRRPMPLGILVSCTRT